MKKLIILAICALPLPLYAEQVNLDIGPCHGNLMHPSTEKSINGMKYRLIDKLEPDQTSIDLPVTTYEFIYTVEGNYTKLNMEAALLDEFNKLSPHDFGKLQLPPLKMFVYLKGEEQGCKDDRFASVGYLYWDPYDLTKPGGLQKPYIYTEPKKVKHAL